MQLLEPAGEALMLLSAGLVLLFGLLSWRRLLRVRRRWRLLVAHGRAAAEDLERFRSLQSRLNRENQRQLAPLRAWLRFARRPLVLALWQSYRRRSAHRRQVGAD
ncbi:MAG: hypothetical protein M3072_05670 [Candidatus Dormibacteraeota bacterium]|nr:hypothetical protein [Candidatus Dormibacteraeota bacterium]